MKYLFLLILLTVSYNNYAQAVKGTVLDSIQNPISYANVMICERSDSSYIQATVTDINGNFEIKHKLTNLENVFIRISRIDYVVKELLLPLIDSIIILQNISISIDKVIVTGKSKFIRIDDSGIVINIKNSILANELSSLDVLSKIPGIIGRDSKITNVYGESPTIYVDGRKLYNIEDLNNITPDQITSIKVNNNPGAEYNSTEKFVVEIKTKKRIDALYVNLTENLIVNDFIGHMHNLNLDYNIGKFNFYGAFKYHDNGQGSKHEKYIKNSVSDIYETYVNTNAIKNNRKALSYMTSVNYNIDKNHSVGVMYSRNDSKINSLFSLNTKSIINNSINDEIIGASDMNDKNVNNNINLFYVGKLGDGSELTVYGDYYNQDFNRKQVVNEESQLNNNEITTSLLSQSRYDLYAVKSILKQKISDKTTISLGVEWSSVSGNGFTDYLEESDFDSDYLTNENNIAGFMSYSLNLKQLSLNIGLRYEHIDINQKYPLNTDDDLKRSYNHFLPNINVTYNIGKVQNIISYKAGVARPSFASLGAESSYFNSFQREEGNSSLQPQIDNKIEYTSVYKDLVVGMSYSNVKNYISMDILQDENNEQVTIFTWKNYDKYQRLSLFASYSRRFGFYQPMSTVVYNKPFLEVDYMSEGLDIDKQTFYVSINNYFHITPLLTFNINYSWTSGGVSHIYTTSSFHRFDTSLKYQLFNKKLMIALSVNDIFNKDIDRLESSINSTYIRSIENNNRQQFMFSAIWRFNNVKDRYKGQTAGKSTINRLQ